MTLFELFGLLRKHLVILIVLPLIAGAAAFVWARFLPNMYTTSTTMYVLSRNAEEEEQTEITQTDLSVGSMLSSDVSSIMTSSRVKRDVAEMLGINSVGGYSFVIPESKSSRVLTLQVTGPNPQLAADIANATVEAASRVAQEVMNIQSINPIDEATTGYRSGPNRRLYVTVGMMAGFFLAVAIIVLRDLLDTRVRSGAEAEEIAGVPVVGHFPAVDA